MMKKDLLIFATLLTGGLFFNACTNEDDHVSIPTEANTPASTSMDKETGMARFSEILSQAACTHKEVRDFLKAEALDKFDNGHNVFYSLVKDKKAGNGQSLKQILEPYAKDAQELSDIEAAVPLLNIHLPEIAGPKVSDIDTDDDEIPVLYNNQFYLNGKAVETLADGEIPGFAVFVVDESGSVQKKQGAATRSGSALSINDEYEFVDAAFSPRLTNEAMTRTSGYEILPVKYVDDGLVPQKDIDPDLLKAYRSSTHKLSATRAMMYYGMATPDQTPNSMRTDVKDCIFRFKIAGDAFERLEAIATDNGNKPFFNGSTSKKKSGLTREEVLNRLMTGRAFCFMFRIEGVISDGTVVSEGMKIYVTPEKLFNLYINESRRHGTMMRHSKFTYSINKNNIGEKWFYPMDHGHDTRLNTWNITEHPIEKKIVVYLIDPNDGQSKKITETYTVTYVTNNEAGANISGKIKDILNIGINGKVGSSTTTTKQITTTYTVNYKNERLDEYQFNFFDDYPIEGMKNNGKYVIPYRKGRGIIETSILPVSNYFFNIQRFQ